MNKNDLIREILGEVVGVAAQGLSLANPSEYPPEHHRMAERVIGIVERFRKDNPVANIGRAVEDSTDNWGDSVG